MDSEPQYIDLDNVIKSKSPRIYKKIPRFVMNYLKRKIHVDELNEILRLYVDDQGVDFMKSVIGYFNLNLNIHGLDKIPNDGKYIFASNHPLGGLDGICLSAVIGEKYDHKIKYQVNDLLMNIHNLRPIFIPINSVSKKQSKENARLINEAFLSDNQIVTFPAGLCSRKQKGVICDLEWKKSFIQKAVDSKRDIVPVYFDGKNSNFFYRFANIRKSLGIKFNLEMFFLPDELFKNKNETFSIVFGDPISYTTFDKSKSVSEWAKYVKEKSYTLAKRLK